MNMQQHCIHCGSSQEFHVEEGRLWDGTVDSYRPPNNPEQHDKGRIELSVETCLECFTVRFVNSKLEHEALLRNRGNRMLKDSTMQELSDKLVLLKEEHGVIDPFAGNIDDEEKKLRLIRFVEIGFEIEVIELIQKDAMGPPM